MIVFKDAEKHDPKEDGMYLCILKDSLGYCYSNVLFSEDIGWKEHEVVAFSETSPETALKGISEDPEETVYGCENISADNHYCRMHESALSIKLPCECKKREDCKYNEYED